jgi:hypothetical protein
MGGVLSVGRIVFDHWRGRSEKASSRRELEAIISVHLQEG